LTSDLQKTPLSFSFPQIFAMVLVVVGRDTWPAVLVRGNVHLALQPVVAGATFVVYCPLLLLGFALNRRTPPLVVSSAL